MVEIEIGVLRGQCPDRRIGERDVLVSEIEAWQRQRNASGARTKWQFTTEKPAPSWRGRIRTSPKSPNYFDELLGWGRPSWRSPECRIALHFISAHCIHLDPMERLTGLTHKQVNHNRCNATFADLKAAILTFAREELPRKWDIYCIPRSGENPKILGRDDTDVIRYLITIGIPFSGHLLAQKGQDRGFEVGKCRVASIVGDVLVHQAP